ncbi:recombinase family protein, partial [Spirosoma sp. 209]|uniref:recombinase family protein n=1 Tax=Spirosoma sp. 209 TaxID=1955701 RepID=UPI001F271921
GRALVTDDSVHYLRSYIVRSNQYLLYYSGGIKMPGTHFDYPEFRDFEKRIVSEKSPLAPNYEKACEIAKKLSSQYDISVAVLDHDRDFYADEFIKKSIQEDIYFVSAESPEETAKITEHLIKFQQHKFRLMIDAATTKRVEQSASNNVALSKSINEVRSELLASNPNKKPALSRIAEILNERGVVSPRGKESKWYAETVKRILERTPKDINESPKTGHEK